MSQTISIANKPGGDGLPSDRQSHKPRSKLQRNQERERGFERGKPKISPDVSWRRDGDKEQIIVLSKEGLPLPLLLNLTSARIFSLCTGENSLEDIARLLCEEFDRQDYAKILEDVQKQAGYFLEQGLIRM